MFILLILIFALSHRLLVLARAVSFGEVLFVCCLAHRGSTVCFFLRVSVSYSATSGSLLNMLLYIRVVIMINLFVLDDSSTS